ncbi:MAG: OadG family protein [Oscillospiraceae bacterium]|nr:OadG family protein [Oscillospiraceae bacterium]
MNLDPNSSLVTGKGISLGEAFGMGGETVVIGLSIVFGVLLILMIVLYLFGVIFNKKPKTATTPAQETVPEPEVQAEVVEEDEEELIAVLTAAIAASLNTSTYNLQIKSYRRVPTKRPAWNNAGLRETIGNRF